MLDPRHHVDHLETETAVLLVVAVQVTVGFKSNKALWCLVSN